MMITSQGNADQHGIRFLAVEFAEGDVGLAIFADHLPRLERKVAQFGHAVRRVDLPGCKRWMKLAALARVGGAF